MNRLNQVEKIIRNNFNKKKIDIAEIGVFEGKITFHLLNKLNNIENYYCIDSWELYDEYKESLYSDKWKNFDWNLIYKNFIENSKKFDNIIIYRMKSLEAVKKFKDKSLDFIFIDGNHSYEYTKNDIINWRKKLKDGGVLAGHDYRNDKYGVKKAVDELIENFNVTNTIWYAKY